MRLPDFIIIGAMKCATSTLHEQLAAQIGIVMSTPKEPCFFSDDAEYARGIDWYTSLFAQATSSDLCGESSTHYTKLPTYPHTVERMKRHLCREVRLIYIMRDPMARLVSQYIHEWTQRTINVPIDEAVQQHPHLVDYSRYAMQLEPFLDAFGHEAILPVFHESLVTRSQEELDRIGGFIGYAGHPAWRKEHEQQNASAERLRSSPWRDAIVNFPGVKALRRALVPQSVRDRIKSFWTIGARPELSAATKSRLAATFNDDLATLGRWLGREITCENFTRQAVADHPAWARAQGVGIT